jgi:hypothetical protein
MVACNCTKVASAALLAPRQLGFGITRGAEAAVQAARRYVYNMQHSQLFLKTDFRNAFNALCRDSILKAVARYFLELLQFTLSTTGHTSNLQFGDYLLQSVEGAQQGAPLQDRSFLELNQSKCEVMGHTIKTWAMFSSYSINLPETSASEVIFLGAPLLAGPHLDSVLERKRLRCSGYHSDWN